MSGAGGRRAALVVVAAVTVVVSGCGLGGGGGSSSSPTPGKSTGVPSPSIVSTPTPDHVDWNNPTAVCNAFADTLFSGDPDVETQTDPITRAAKFVTSGYRDTFVSSAPRLAQWDDWDQAGATQLVHTPVRYVGDKFGKDTRTRKYRVASRRVYPADPQGNPVGQTYGFVVYCTLVREQGHWRVADHSQDNVDPQP
ncbi:MAG: hypothetical protein J2P24_09080 [Streptosporangiales bacterium]|nr:hypothetical protein [Streptosporangiales bacterium]MBO0889749.1 hypothetical protein [Acidothermales bacterium]